MSLASWRLSRAFPPTLKPKHALVQVRVLDGTGTGEATSIAERPWRPVTLGTSYFASLLVLTACLIAAIACLPVFSERNQGIIFAKDINNLPLKESFSYLYLPTMISSYSFLWTWVDLDIKRLEPYFQLSQSGGVNASGSVLLSYPLEFLLTLPFVAFKHRHWCVLSASVVMMLVFWGLTPMQAGIFATRTVTIDEALVGTQSTGYTPLEDQGNMSTIYAQSVYNIAWLNESLPAFMTTEYALSPFGYAQARVVDSENVTFTSRTTKYSVDVSCTGVTLWDDPEDTSLWQYQRYNSTNGCSFRTPTYRPSGGTDINKLYDMTYTGYQWQKGSADIFLSQWCNSTFLHSFFVRWTKTTPERVKDDDLSQLVGTPAGNESLLFCEPTYYQQQVEATITLPNNSVVASTPIGPKQPLPADFFNTTNFGWLMGITDETTIRTDYPSTIFPNQNIHMASTAINPADIPKMGAFAYALTQQPLDRYLEPEVLRSSYEAAYRLLFARAIVDILHPSPSSLDDSTKSNGRRTFVIQAVVVVPAFAYTAIALLFLVLCIGCGIAQAVPQRPNLLLDDPATIGAVMDLTEHDANLIQTFARLNAANSQTMDRDLSDATFELTPDVHRKLRLLRTNDELNDEAIIGIVFLVLQIAAAIAFLALFLIAIKQNGLALPSQSTFVRQLVQNYIPITFATLVEPFWLVLNRYLCYLQPYEQLRKGNAPARTSIDVDYSSLPPQLLFWRAARAKHFILLLVCFMVLMANVLAVALGGLMYEGEREIARAVNLSAPYVAAFDSLDGINIPVGTSQELIYDGSTTDDGFFRMMSNLTADTPLPPWTDSNNAYLSVDLTGVEANSFVDLATTAFSATPRCRLVETAGQENFTLNITQRDATAAVLQVNLINDSGTPVRCMDYMGSLATNVAADKTLRTLLNPLHGHVALEIGTMLASNGTDEENLFCRQHVLAGWIRADFEYNTTGFELKNLPNMDLISRNETTMACRPIFSMGPAKIRVDHLGRILETYSINLSPYGTERFFNNCTEFDLAGQAHRFIPDVGRTWHNDLYPSDFMNYLITKSTNDTSLLDPSLPPPTFEHASQQFTTLYTKLFAIWVATHQSLLFNRASSSIPTTVPSLITTPSTRILFSTPAFIITEIILTCYILTTIYFYARRPWKVLPRLPSTIASNIAFFAASRGFKDLAELRARGTEDARGQRGMWRWGLGRFVGDDGKEYYGIEREGLIIGREREGVEMNMGRAALYREQY